MNSVDWSQDTIVALATPSGEGGIGILRVSGPQAPKVVAQIWSGRKSLEQLDSHRLYLGDLIDPQTRERLDTGMVVWMRAPCSYTGEEVVEIHAHGGPLLLSRLLSSLLRLGLRAAEPGEFTRRAFLNGKLDLLQAEAVGELIHAKSEAALRSAHSQLEGRLSKEVREMRRRILRLRAELEAAIDFPDEDIEIQSSAHLLSELQALQVELRRWLDKFQVGRLMRDGVRLALLGPPNVGKSSLLNRLLEEDRAIVHSKPGTTRDVIEGWMELEGLQFRLFDTAGLREGEEEVEQEGIRRSQQVANQADLCLWIRDASALEAELDLGFIGKILRVYNKIDLLSADERGKRLQANRFTKGNREGVAVSARTGEGLEALKAAILKTVGLEAWRQQEHAFLNNARHREAIQRGLEALERAEGSLRAGQPLECSAADLKEAGETMEALIGKVDSEDILGEIFSTFCIGK